MVRGLKETRGRNFRSLARPRDNLRQITQISRTRSISSIRLLKQVLEGQEDSGFTRSSGYSCRAILHAHTYTNPIFPPAGYLASLGRSFHPRNYTATCHKPK